MIQPIPTHRPWWQRVVLHFIERWQQERLAGALQRLDRRTLTDLGLDRSEAASVAAESGAQAPLTRLRIAAATRAWHESMRQIA